MASIDDLLQALSSPTKSVLANTKDTWERIGRKDSFAELGLEPSELESFLKEFTENNDYNNI